MHRHRTILTSIAGTLLLHAASHGAMAAWQPPAAPPPVGSDAQPADASASVPMGTVSVERETLLKLDDDGFDHVTRARECFRKRQRVDAAAYLRRAGWIFGLVERAVRASRPSESVTPSIAQRLEEMAHACDHRDIDGDRDFDQRLVGIHAALAGLMHEQAHAAWTDRREREAAYYLRSASRHVEVAAEFAEAPLDRTLKPRVHGARVVGGKVIGDTGWTREEVERALAALDEGIDWVNTKVVPAAAPTEQPSPAISPAGGLR